MGKKGGKGGKNKMAKMSEEERARYLQHRADIEEEARRRKQQLIALYMKNKLKKEEAFSRLNLAKINQEWRSLLRQIKCKELNDELKIVEKVFRETLDRKNSTIIRLLKSLDTAEETYAIMLRSHMKNITKLIHIHGDRLMFWTKKYDEEKALLLRQYITEYDRYLAKKGNMQVRLECVYFELEKISIDCMQNDKEKHLQNADTLKSSMILQLEYITRDRENQMELLWRELQSILNAYLKQTEEFYTDYQQLRQNDNEDTQLIRSHYLEVARSTELIGDMRNEIEERREEWDSNVRMLRKYRDQLQMRCNHVKKGIQHQMENNKNIFRKMVVASNDAIKSLERQSKVTETLLQKVSRCRRYETENEKILPFGIDELSDQIEVALHKDQKSDDGEFELSKEAKFVHQHMEYFWMRLNRAQVDKLCLLEEKRSLIKENDFLKNKLRQHLAKVAVADGVPDGGCNNRILRPHSMKVEKVMHIKLNELETGKTKRPVTCVEGNMCVAVRSRSLVTTKAKISEIYSVVH